jgi:hypothetical protein
MTQTTETPVTEKKAPKYELLVWDFDPDPDEGGYYVVERWTGDDLEYLARRAEKQANDDGAYVGAWIFLEGKPIKGAGMNCGYTPKPPRNSLQLGT